MAGLVAQSHGVARISRGTATKQIVGARRSGSSTYRSFLPPDFGLAVSPGGSVTALESDIDHHVVGLSEISPSDYRAALALFAVACGLLAASVCEAAGASGPVSAPAVVNADWQGPALAAAARSRSLRDRYFQRTSLLLKNIESR